MSENSKIEWTDATWTPVRARRRDTGKVGWHCEKVSPACDNCYAAAMNKRSDGLVGIGTGLNYAPDSLPKVEIYMDEEMLLAPLRWKRPRKIFVCSMTDLYGHWVTDEMLDRIHAVMALCPQHTFQVLTKRPARRLDYLSRFRLSPPLDGFITRDGVCHDESKPGSPIFNPRSWPLPNVWQGVTAENQAMWDERAPVLKDTPAAVRFISAEPLLSEIRADLSGIDWVIVGGESGRKARPMHPDWARSLRDQCQAAGVALHFKQWGEWVPTDQTRFQDGLEYRLFPNGALMPWADFELGPWDDDDAEEVVKIGTKSAGRRLDGREWSDFPEVAQ